MNTQKDINMKVAKWFKLLNEKAEANKETIQSKDFQAWLIHVKAERVVTSNYINK